MMNKKITLLLSIFILGFLVIPQIAAARIVPECNHADVAGCNLCDFFLLIMNIYDFIVFKLAPPVAGLLIVAAGALFLVSGGSEERVSQAKKIFVNVIIGLVFIYASWLIVNSIIQVIGKSTEGFNPTSWWQFDCK